MGENSVRLRTYCTAFSVIGPDPATGTNRGVEICNKLHDHWRLAGDNFLILNDEVGDGKVSALFYDVSLGSKKPIKWNYFSSEDRCTTDDSCRAFSYFVAGAFGLSEVPKFIMGFRQRYSFDLDDDDPIPSNKKNVYQEDLDASLVEGIQKLYKRCLDKGETECLSSPEAQFVRAGMERLRTPAVPEKKDDEIKTGGLFENFPSQICFNDEMGQQVYCSPIF